MFMIIIASSCVSCSYFFDADVLPKQISMFLLSGLCCLLLALNGRKKREIEVYALDMHMVGMFLLLLCVFLINGDVSAMLNLLSLGAVYLVCRHEIECGVVDKLVFVGIILCGLYSVIVALCQFVIGDNVNGGYDTLSGLSLTCALCIVFMLNYLNGQSSSIIIFAMMTFFIVFLLLLSARTAIIAICVSLLLMLKGYKRVLLAMVGVFLVVSLSVYKQDSTKGRFFIYSTSIMLLGSPNELLWGHGCSGFASLYMPMQAKSLKQESASTRMLADNIKHPLNEYLLFAINYGVLMLACVLFFASEVMRTRMNFLPRSILTTIVIFSFFTYPFHYPITYVMIAYALSRVKGKRECVKFTSPRRKAKLRSVICVVYGLILLFSAVAISKWNICWKKAYVSALYGAYEKSVTEYRKLAEFPLATAEFHYNMAYTLLMSNMAEDAFISIKKCGITNYDTQMLRGDVAAARGLMKESILFYNEAADMCPNRIMPLYAQYCLYDKQGNINIRDSIGNIILKKAEKVPSTKVHNIKKRVYNSMYNNQ